MNKSFTQKNIEEIDGNIKDRVIRAAWEDDVSFDSIYIQYGFTEAETIKIMKSVMKPKMFILWRTRVRGRHEKHFKKMILTSKGSFLHESE